MKVWSQLLRNEFQTFPFFYVNGSKKWGGGVGAGVAIRKTRQKIKEKWTSSIEQWILFGSFS